MKLLSKNKVLFVVSTYQQYQNYIQSGGLKEFGKDLFFIANPKLKGMDFGVSEANIFYYSYPSRKDTLHRHIFNINTWQNRNKHNSFWIRTLLFTKRQKQIYRILSLPILSSLAKFIFLKKAQDQQLAELINKIEPSIILLPSHAFEGRTFEIIRIAKEMRVPSFMVTDNWDTLANKTIFTIKPDYLGTWSEQQIEHAITIREMPRDRIYILGAPRFMDYFKPENRNQPSPYPFKYILYVGMSEHFDELGALRKIDDIIEKKGLNIKVIHRPAVTQHTRKCPDVFFEYDFKHIILDTPAKLYYKKSATWDISSDGFNPIYFPDQKYFTKLLSNMEFMICPQSTMMLESSIYNKRTYLLAYDDGLHRFGPKWVFENGLHLKGIEKLSNIRMIDNFEDMEKIFSPGDQLKKDCETIDIDYFVSRKATANYASNLRETIDLILKRGIQN
jgi:hypothetical protein